MPPHPTAGPPQAGPLPAGPPAADPTRQPDPDYPGLSVADVAWIRSAGQRILAEHGIEVTPGASGIDLVGADGTHFALDTLVHRCRTAPRPEWESMVHQHFGAMARSQGDIPPEELTAQQRAAQVRTRLISTEQLAEPVVNLSYARPVTDDLAAVLCIDYPETVCYLAQRHVADLDLDELFRQGQRNTDAEPVDLVRPVGESGILGVVGSSMFIASKTLNVAALLARVYDRDAPYGAVFAVPDRSTVLVHLVESASAIAAIGELARIAAGWYENAVGPVSPNVYHWYRDATTRISSADPESRNVQIVPGPVLSDILTLLAEREEDR